MWEREQLVVKKDLKTAEKLKISPYMLTSDKTERDKKHKRQDKLRL